MYALIYLDDLIIYSKTEEEHLVRLHAVLERFMENGLKLKPSKCNFFCTEISYLGHKVSVAGMEPGTEGLKGITEIAPPARDTQVRKFLGTTGYFRRFIKGYAKIANPVKRPAPRGEQQAQVTPSRATARCPHSIPGTQDEVSHRAGVGLNRLQEALPAGN